MSEIETVGVIGAGVMGGGIAQSLAQAGYRVVCTDIAEEALETGAGHPLEWTRIHEDYLALVEQQLERFCAREGVTSQEVFAATRNAVEDGDLSATQIMPGFLHSLVE